MDKTKKIRSEGSFSLEERHSIIREYLESGVTKQAIWYKYTGMKQEHGGLTRWMRKLGYLPGHTTKPRIRYPKAPQPIYSNLDAKEPDKTPEELKSKIKELEKQLEMTRIKAEGYEIMIDIAENELNVPIRKKPDTK